jgi:predicted negative regulator of RcsB-dependent stress response
LAKYKKKRARELKHDRFRDATMLLADRLADRVAGRRQQILYGLIALVVIAIGVYAFVRWRHKHAEEAQAAMGRAIAINAADIGQTPPPGSKDPVFSSQQERSERAIHEFEKIAAKYGEPYRTEALYFIATNELVTNRLKAEADLQNLTQGSSETATLAKFALAQAKESDGNLAEAARLYGEIAQASSPVVTPNSANLRLADVYNKQGKKKEAADILFNMVDTARKAKDKDGKPVPESSASREAAQELLKIDPTRHAQLPPPPSPLSLF